MSVARACLSCRNAKAKCDLVRPTCGRCKQRGLYCSGFADNTGFIFLDESQKAKRNSQRARRGSKRSPNFSISFDIRPPQLAQIQQTQTYEESDDKGLELQYSWLNKRAITEVPTPLKRDIETRAVDRFFINWTLHPDNRGISPGHMQDLPALYLSASPESVLWLAVRAVAFADLRNERSSTNVPFYIKARQHYGAALSRTRALVLNETGLDNDRVLAAILLIDNFELMYLARSEPLGPHSEIVKHILHSRGDGQLFDSSRFALWRLANHRLQARQTLLRERPDDEQIRWVSKLNIDRPDLHICADVLHMNILSAAAKTLTEKGREEGNRASRERLYEARQLAGSIRSLITSIDSWTSEMTGVWKPEVDDIQQPWEIDGPSNLPIPQFPCAKLLRYHDIWLAYMWTFHAACQIVLRESLIDVINHSARWQTMEDQNMEDFELIEAQRNYVDVLSACIIRSFPLLLGFTHHYDEPPRSLPQGKMAGRMFSLSSLWVVQKAQFTSDQHKKTASEVIAWLNSRHGLG